MADPHPLAALLEGLEDLGVAAHRHVVTLEDHLTDGGFGSWMLEALTSTPELLPRVSPIALDPAVCATVGSQAWLNRLGGLTPPLAA